MTDPSTRRTAFLGWVQRLISLGGVLLCLGTAVGAARLSVWPWSLCQHLRFLFFVGLVMVLACEVVGRRWRWALLVLICAGWNWSVLAGSHIAPEGHPVGSEVPKAGCVMLSVAQYNVRTRNTRYDLVGSSLRQEGADIVGLLEVSEAWLQGLADVRDQFPYRVDRPRSDNFGIALWSTYPLESVEIVDLGGTKLPSIAATVALRGRPIEVLVTHLLPPRRGLGDLQERQLVDLESRLDGDRAPDVVMGDLNLSPWTDAYDRLTSGSHRDARRGFGVLPSWPDLVGTAWIPIDHLLVTGRVAVESIRIGPRVGSDHRPVFATLWVRQR